MPVMKDRFEDDDEYFKLDSFWEQKAFNDLGETAELVRTNVRLLRNAIAEDDSLISRKDANFLLAFLRARKHNVKKSIKMLKQFYYMRQKYKIYYVPCLLPENELIYRLGAHVILPERDLQGRLILVIKPGNWDVSLIDAVKCIRSVGTTLTIALDSPLAQIGGVVMLLDLMNFTLYQQAKLLNLKSIYIAINFIQDTFPMRLQGIQIVNEPWCFEALYTMFKPFLKEKLRKRIKVHGDNWTSLHQFVPENILPADYGGSGPDLSIQPMLDSLNSYNDKLIEWSTYGYGK